VTEVDASGYGRRTVVVADTTWEAVRPRWRAMFLDGCSTPIPWGVDFVVSKRRCPFGLDVICWGWHIDWTEVVAWD
jgi:hypothetical protein